jgi:phytoene dehydrogenase-like protein
VANQYDVIVIGAGHNGLVTAGLLAKSGRNVLILERREILGGMCAGEEFHSGYRSPGLLHDTVCLRPSVIDALNLTQHGLQLTAPPDVLVPQIDGDGLLLAYDADAASKEFSVFSERDADRYRDYRGFIEKVRKVVEPVLNDALPDINSISAGGMLDLARQGLAFRLLGSRDMMELMRIPPMCVGDWTREWFETELICAALAGPAVEGTWAGPWSPGTASNLLMWECTAGRSVSGGASELVFSLERAVKSLGVTIRTAASVQRINIKNGAATGVVLDGGEEIGATTIVSSCDPKTTFLDFIQPGDISPKFAERLRMYRTRGTTAKVHLALSKPLRFASRPDHVVEFARTGETLDDIERSFDAVKYRRFSDKPMLSVYVPTEARPEYAPAGHSVVSILVHFAPYQCDEGWGDDVRERLGDVVMKQLESYAPGVSSSVVAREVLSPLDIETRYGTTQGHVHHGEHGLDQLITRPTLETARYATPIGNLFLCGASSHPGGGVTGAPGAIAAQHILSHL